VYQDQEQELERELYQRQPALTYTPAARDLNERWHARRRARAWACYCEAHAEQLAA
jgi:hypothetical protein